MMPFPVKRIFNANQQKPMYLTSPDLIMRRVVTLLVDYTV